MKLHRLVIERGVTDASASTIWRWLEADRYRLAGRAVGEREFTQLATSRCGCFLSLALVFLDPRPARRSTITSITTRVACMAVLSARSWSASRPTGSSEV
jgi:hypothetical protein